MVSMQPTDAIDLPTGGISCDLDLGDRRVNWNRAEWVTTTLDSLQDWSSWDGFTLQVRTEEPRTEVGATLAICVAGCWYAHPWSCGLAAPVNQGQVRFAHFHPAEWIAPQGGSHSDALGWLDVSTLKQVEAWAIGVVNPLGVGRVHFVLESVTAVLRNDEPASPARVQVSGRPLIINGCDRVPAGLFGTFNLKPGTIERYRLHGDRAMHHTGISGDWQQGSPDNPMLNTIGDRVRPSPWFTHADWQERSSAHGTEMGAAAAAQPGPRRVEYWNEPYLNWANLNRANFNPTFFDIDLAEEQGPVHLRGEAVPHLRWTKEYTAVPWNWCQPKDWRRGRAEDGTMHSSVHAPPYKGMAEVYGGTWTPALHPPLDLAEGTSYEADGLQLSVTTPWHVFDETQFTHWSGRAMLRPYVACGEAFLSAFKAACPDSLAIVGWGNRPSEDHWAAWELLYRPAIDALAPWTDAVGDHDYGGHPGKMVAVYEFTCAYGMQRHGRWLMGANTECASAADPQAIPGASLTAGALGRKAWWCAHKILAHAARCPDKTALLCHFGHGGPWFSEDGEGIAFDLLRSLRGRLVDLTSSDDRLLAVACVDGTDPDCPKPADLGPGTDLVVAIANSAAEAILLDLSLPADVGAGLHAQVMDPVTTAVSSQALEGLVLAPKAVALVRIPGWTLPDAGTVTVRQYFGDSFLEEVVPGEPVTVRVAIPAQQLTMPGSWWLRCGVEHLGLAAGQVHIGSHSCALPAAPTAENSVGQIELLLPDEVLNEHSELTFTCSRSDAPGFRLCSVSVLHRSEADEVR